MEWISYSKKLFEERILANQDTIDLCHIGPMMVLCSDEEGFWVAVIRREHGETFSNNE